MKGKILAFPVALFIIVAATSIVLAQMGVPHQFYGTVTYNGAASAGIKVDAYIEGVVVETTFTQSNGFYNLKVQDPDENRAGDTILFYVNDVNTGQTAIFENGASTELNLAVSSSTSGGDSGGSSGGGGGGGSSGSSSSSSSSTGTTVDTGTNTNSESSDENQESVGGGITGAAIGAGSSKGLLTLLIILFIVIVGILGYFGLKKRPRKNKKEF